MALVKGIGKTGSANWKGREQTALQAWKGGDMGPAVEEHLTNWSTEDRTCTW